MDQENKRVVEINGVKIEVDLRTAKRVDTLKVGDTVKVLIKTYNAYKVWAGVVIGFEPFNKLPTIIVAHMEVDYNSADIKFIHYNAETKDTEVIKALDDDRVDLNKTQISQSFEGLIAKKREEIAELERKRNYFINNFRSYWENLNPDVIMPENKDTGSF